MKKRKSQGLWAFIALESIFIASLLISTTCLIHELIVSASAEATVARDVWEFSGVGFDAGLAIGPPKPGEAGYAELWVYPWDANDYLVSLHISGADPLPYVTPMKQQMLEQVEPEQQTPGQQMPEQVEPHELQPHEPQPHEFRPHEP